jgi:hypothetical protein
MLTFAHCCLLHRQIIESALRFISAVYSIKGCVYMVEKSLLVKSTEPIELNSNRCRQ